MLDSKTASTIATSIVHSKFDYCNSVFVNLDSTQIQRLQLIQNSLALAVTRMPRHHHITPVLKSLHWLKIPERIQCKVLSLTYNSLESSQPFESSSPSSQPALLDHHPVSPFLDPQSLLISSSPTEPYPSLHHVFGMTYHLNSAPFLYLHHRLCQSQDIIFILLLYPSPPGLPLKNRNVISSNTPTLTHLIIHPPHLNDTHL